MAGKKERKEPGKKNSEWLVKKKVKVKVKNLSYKLLVFGYRGLIKKHKTNDGDEPIKNKHFINLTFRMLVNTHFQKYNRCKF